MNIVKSLFFFILLAGLLLASWAGLQPEGLDPNNCACPRTSDILFDKADDGSTAQVNVNTCMEPGPCNSESLDVTDLSPSDPQISEEMEEKLEAKGDIYALLEIEPDGKTWDPAIEIMVVLDVPAPRDNFSLSILRWIEDDNDWRKQGTAIADRKFDMLAKGEISHTSLYAFVSETGAEPTVAEPPPAITVTIPDVIGLPSDEARKLLEGENLNVSLFRQSAPGSEPDTVLSMEPKVGQEVALESYVILIVSAEPEKAGLIPNVIGLPLPDAVNSLKQVGLTATGYQNQDSEEEDGTVIGIEPGVGTKVAFDEEIFLIVAENPTVIVPDLIGDSLESALESIPRYGLAAGQLISIESSQPVETVIDMQPGPGAEVAYRTIVDLYYAIPETGQLPDVTGYHFEDATAILQRSGLNRGNIIEVEPEYPYTEDGTVRYTNPQAGALVEIGSAVDLYVVVPEAEPVELPDVTGYHFEDATAILQRSGLNRGNIIEVEPEYPYTEDGTVRYTNPQAGALVEIGSAVDLYVVVPEAEPVELPDVTGYHFEDATAILQRSGLNRGNIIEVEPEYPYSEDGIVRYTNPQAGALVEIGSAVDLYVVKVEPVEQVELPDVTGYHVEDAIATLQAWGLNRGNIIEVGSEYPYTEDGTVRYTNPQAGALVEIGSAVDLYVVKVDPVEQVELPDVTGYHVEDAIATLQASGLSRGEIIEVKPDYPFSEDGIVRSTNPQAGALVDIGSSVDLYVVKVEPVGLPDFTGYHVEDAIATLQAWGLNRGEIIEVEPEYPYSEDGIVRSTNPQAGTLVDVGSAVDLYVVKVEQVELPDVTGYSIERARTALNGQGLNVGNIFEVEPAYPYSEDGTVRYTNPQAGALVDIGSTVDLYVVKVEQVELLDVTGYSTKRARTALNGQGLNVGNIFEVEPAYPYNEDGTVRYTNPQARALVDVGSAVDLYVVKVDPVEQVEMPNVIGSYVEGANATLRNSGLNNVNIIEVDPSDDVYIAGLVLDTRPGAGTIVPNSTPINVYVNPLN